MTCYIDGFHLFSLEIEIWLSHWEYTTAMTIYRPNRRCWIWQRHLMEPAQIIVGVRPTFFLTCSWKTLMLRLK